MFLDTHCHLSDPALFSDKEGILARAKAQGVQKILSIACDLSDARQILGFADGETVFATVGFHPTYALNWQENAVSHLEKMVSDARVVAIGEIGLDWVYDDQNPKCPGATHEFQREIFEIQLELAARLGLPVIIHNRDAGEEILEILTPFAPKLRGGVFHCFGQGEKFARRVLDLGFHLGFGGLVTFKNAPLAHESVRFCPPDRMLLETDAPYLAPHPHRGKQNEPSFIPFIAQKIAELKGVSLEEVESQTTQNAFTLFPKLR